MIQMRPERRVSSTSLSSRIINWLIQRGHSQVDIARMLGVSQGFVSLVKSRERGLTLDHLERIALEISMPLGEFLIAVTEPPAGTPDPSGLRTAMAETLKKADKVREAFMQIPASKSTHS
jgi:transcriptional regulator with XRE-family HTH domain